MDNNREKKEFVKGIKENWKSSWNNFRSKLEKGLLQYEYINENFVSKEIGKYEFLNQLYILLESPKQKFKCDSNNKEYFTIDLKKIDEEFSLCRGVVEDNEDKIKYSRFIPYQDKFPRNNRFSPPGIEYLYLAIDVENSNPYNFNNRFSKLEKTCIKEIRADRKKKIGLCNFKIDSKYYNKKIIDLTIGKDKSESELVDYGVKVFGKEEELNKVMCILFMKILSREIFKPINVLDKDKEYAPFHCMAKFFSLLGFDGIIFESTCYNKGKNIVLFDKLYAKPYGEIRKEIY